MPDPERQTEGKEAPPSRLDEGRRVVQEYAAELREIVRKLRQRLLQ